MISGKQLQVLTPKIDNLFTKLLILQYSTIPVVNAYRFPRFLLSINPGFHDLWFVVTLFEGFWFTKRITKDSRCTKSYKILLLIHFATDTDILGVRKSAKNPCFASNIDISDVRKFSKIH